MKDLFDLPFEIQVVLAIGYLSYKLAFTGLDKKHKTLDVFMLILVYGAIAYSGIEATKWMEGSYWAGVGVGLTAALASATAWRRWGRKASAWILRKGKISWDSFSPTTWDGIIQNTDHVWAYVTVHCTDGTILRSDMNALPKGLPNGPCQVDSDGNVAIYVTSKKTPELAEVDYGRDAGVDDEGRAHITYVPAANIQRLTISRLIDQLASTAPEGAASSQD